MSYNALRLATHNLSREARKEIIASGVSESELRPRRTYDFWNDNTTGVCLGLMIGKTRQDKLQAAIMSIVAAFSVFCGTLVSSAVATFHPQDGTHDFYQKGTISNLAQDVSTPQGRIWSASLIVGSMLLLMSMYPFWLYRSWHSLHCREENPIIHACFQTRPERVFRTIWLILPQVGLIIAGAIPTVSDATSHGLVMVGIHNFSAPTSMFVMMICETLQLEYGENAFRSFWKDDIASELYGKLNLGQKLRVVVCIATWVCGLSLILVQGYLFVVFNETAWIALVSYYSEVFGIILAFSLPAISGIDYILEDEHSDVGAHPLLEAERVILKYLSEPLEYLPSSSAPSEEPSEPPSDRGTPARMSNGQTMTPKEIELRKRR